MKILLTSVFGPFGVDDAYGRKENIMELFHNQVTREQGVFSLRFNHPSFGLHFLAENISASTTVLDFPSQQKFIKEIKQNYDYVGISFIVPNFIKAKKMAELVRKYAPNSKIILGGHGVRIPGIKDKITHDFICQGEGVRWLRRLLGEDVNRSIKHPIVSSAFSKKVMGVPLKSDTAVLIPGLGCPNACRFCVTSHFFDKKYVPYFSTGQELFDICVEIEEKIGVNEFFIMDENFLKLPDRARELLQLIEKHNKSYQFSIFSSAETVAALGVEFLCRLGVNFIWLGIESKQEIYEKNRGLDLKSMISQLRDHGISVLASAILFLEHHDKQSIWEDIRFAVEQNSDFVQFMGLGPMPGTALYEDYRDQGILREDLPYEEWHGQHQIWFHHPNFSASESVHYLREAFRYDYNIQGASLLRICDTVIRGYEHLKHCRDPMLIKRCDDLKTTAKYYRAALLALKKFAHNANARILTQKVTEKYDTALGPATLKQKVQALLMLLYAMREKFRVSLKRNVYQPKIITTRYQRPIKKANALLQLVKKSTKSRFNLDINWSAQPTVVTPRGLMYKKEAKQLANAIKKYLIEERRGVVVRLEGLMLVKSAALHSFLRRVRDYQQQVTVVLEHEVEVVRQAIKELPEELSSLIQINV
ncbi:MAG: cobalamin-dependent protein [Deltaproteobacteria bacterium]|nr:cobalamin-dependent protein [Deltaproteobacteria bacterium]